MWKIRKLECQLKLEWLEIRNITFPKNRKLECSEIFLFFFRKFEIFR